MTDKSDTMTIVVADYQPNWTHQFSKLSKNLADIVGANAISIEHVGSTSVPGLAAKPIIDIDIVVSRTNTLQVISALEKYGYKHRGNLGIEDREAFFNPEHAEINHHLYVCAEGSLALRNHLSLRDRLRSNPEEMQAYSKIKRELAAKYPDNIDAYIAGKTEFILSVLKRAEFNESELSSIREPNRVK